MYIEASLFWPIIIGIVVILCVIYTTLDAKIRQNKLDISEHCDKLIKELQREVRGKKSGS